MNDTAVKRSSAPRSDNQDSNDGLPSLFVRLGDELTNLIDLRLNLLKVEIREDVDAFLRRTVTIAIGGIVAAVGFALANVAFAFFMATLFANTHLSQYAKYGLGFMITGLVYLLAGGIVIVVTRKRLASQQLLPERSLAEFENDKQLVKRAIQG